MHRGIPVHEFTRDEMRQIDAYRAVVVALATLRIESLKQIRLGYRGIEYIDTSITDWGSRITVVGWEKRCEVLCR